jgi:hypothetical protein
MSADSTPTDTNDQAHQALWQNPAVIAAIAAALIGALATIFAPLIYDWLSRKPPATTEVIQGSLVGWTKYTDEMGSTLSVSGKPGRTDNAVELLYDLQESGWVGITWEVGSVSLAGSDGLAFYLQGGGQPNTIELKVMYPMQNGINPVFSVNWYASSVTDDWVRLEAYYDQFTCWEATGCDPGSVPDPARVTRIDIAISNKPGDTPGVGVVLLDSIQVIRR